MICPNGKAPNTAGSQSFSVMEVRLEWQWEVQVVTEGLADGLAERYRSLALVLLG
jgi:hypothetical protein